MGGEEHGFLSLLKKRIPQVKRSPERSDPTGNAQIID